LTHNQVTDISALSALTNLTDLCLGYNQINDISALSGLTNVRCLRLCNNHISDIYALSGLTNLTKLFLYNNQICDISSISGLMNLTRLYLQSNQISDISAVAGLTSLEYLGLLNNPLNTPAYYIYLPVISSFNPKLTSLTYDPSPNSLTDDWGIEIPDLIEFASRYGETGCAEYNNWCDGADLNHSGNVDMDDVMEFSKYWFEGTER